MFKRIRQLRISLAAKCQLLFGVAVVLIISAALAVPWQRMEELTRKVDEQAARTLARKAKLEHLARPYARGTISTGDHATTVDPESADEVQHLTSSASGDQAFLPLRFVGVARQTESHALTSFERRALSTFQKESDRDSYSRTYERNDGSMGYRYAMALYAEASCLRCHSLNAGENAATNPSRDRTAFVLRPIPTTSPTTAPTTSVASVVGAAANRNAAPLVGMVTVDIRSNVDTTQLLLNRVFILAAGLLAGRWRSSSSTSSPRG
jgi:hypothetical protein